MGPWIIHGLWTTHGLRTGYDPWLTHGYPPYEFFDLQETIDQRVCLPRNRKRQGRGGGGEDGLYTSLAIV